MNEYLLLYLFTRLDALQALFVFGCVFGSIGLFIGGIALMEEAISVRIYGIIVAAVLISAAGLVAVPSSRDLAVIIGGKYALDVARSEKAQTLGDELYQAVLSELKKRKEK